MRFKRLFSPVNFTMLAALWLASPVFAGNEKTPQVLELYSDGIPGSLPTANLEHLADNTSKDTFIMAVTQPNLTAFWPSSANGTAVIICPGGGYTGVSNVKEGDDVAKRLNQLGITAFVLKYRMPMTQSMQDKSVGPLQDAQQAIYLVRSHSTEWHLDPNKIGIMGFSAGGHLASSAAVHYVDAVNPQLKGKNLRPDFQILIYPVISFKQNLTHPGSRDNLIGPTLAPDKIHYFSNETQINANTPPAFIVHAGDDEVVPVENSLEYYQALHANNVASQLLILPKGGHGFGMRNEFDWFEDLIEWMNTMHIINHSVQ